MKSLPSLFRQLSTTSVHRTTTPMSPLLLQLQTKAARLDFAATALEFWRPTLKVASNGRPSLSASAEALAILFDAAFSMVRRRFVPAAMATAISRSRAARHGLSDSLLLLAQSCAIQLSLQTQLLSKDNHQSTRQSLTTSARLARSQTSQLLLQPQQKLVRSASVDPLVFLRRP